MAVLQTVSRSEIEDFLYLEAELLDSWQLVEWRRLFTEDCAYVVPNLALPGDTPTAGVLHLIVDDGHHLTERVKRLGKKTAHAEHPRSRSRRMITNVRITERAELHLRATSNFTTYRTSQQVTDTYFGQHQYLFVEEEGALRIKEKRTVLDIGSLRPQGRLSIIV
ncbi:MAG: aromatic-ring-hydroxylating dioxygenase subunit beta [Ramlibacter sp.]|nr:aromatic-ring-hydroxylating dioxygenase subunit beta [Ramlibacter sp.]